MLASSSVVSELRLRDACLAHADPSHDCTPLASCCAQQLPPPIDGEIDEYARNFDCNLCVRECYDPVVTMCGHLFCWPCLYLCLSLYPPPASSECPVCRADVRHKIVPLHGCGSGSSPPEKLHGIHIPARPSVVAHNHNHPSQLNPVIQQNGMHPSSSAHSAFYALLQRFGLPSSAPDREGSYLRRHVQGVALRLTHRRRFNNEKEFVLHWLFIIAASATITFFLAC